jgi:thiamine-monophosphate kinase
MADKALGEREIIRRLTSKFGKSGPRLPLGFDDDVSAVPISTRKWLILKTDSLVGSTDVPPRMTLEQASRKAVVATVSDFAAKGVQPSALLISLMLKTPVSQKMVDEIGRGLQAAAREYGARIVGGDTGEARDLVINCTGFGIADPQRVLRRNGARPGDVVAVTGSFGKTSCGLRILLSKRKALAAKFPRSVNAVLHPIAKLKTGLTLAKSGQVTSSMDSSDGLAWSLHEIATQSKARLVLEKVPVAVEAVSYAEKEGLDPKEMALYGGEEYELLLTIRKEGFALLKSRIPSLIKIGTVEKGTGNVLLRTQGERRKVDARGWEHMASKEPRTR